MLVIIISLNFYSNKNQPSTLHPPPLIKIRIIEDMYVYKLFHYHNNKNNKNDIKK